MVRSKWNPFGAFLAMVIIALQCRADDLENVRNAVAEQCKLYKDIEFVVSTRYHSFASVDNSRGAFGGQPPAIAAPANEGGSEILDTIKLYKFVRSNGRHRNDYRSFYFVNGRMKIHAMVYAFDGRTVKQFSKSSGKGWSVSETPSVAEPTAWPRTHMDSHTISLLRFGFQAPLPAIVTSWEATQNHGDGYKSCTFDSYSNSLEDYEGEPCHRVSFDVNRNGEHIYRYSMLLQDSRNMIPVHVSSYSIRVSEKLPGAVGKVTNWQRIAEGVWFPESGETWSYDKKVLATTGEQKLRWVDNYSVDNVHLNPSYEPDYFAGPPIVGGRYKYDAEAVFNLASSLPTDD